jgi:hypothetical protein
MADEENHTQQDQRGNNHKESQDASPNAAHDILL